MGGSNYSASNDPTIQRFISTRVIEVDEAIACAAGEHEQMEMDIGPVSLLIAKLNRGGAWY